MQPTININWKQKAKKLNKKMSVQDAAYKCGVAEQTFRRIMSGETDKVSYDCGVLMLWLLEGGEV